jgi:hypothetical protein
MIETFAMKKIATIRSTWSRKKRFKETINILEFNGDQSRIHIEMIATGGYFLERNHFCI